MKVLYLGIIEDHSGSMSYLNGSALKDVNGIINQYKQAQDDDLAIIATTSMIYNSKVEYRDYLMPVSYIKDLTLYRCSGNTPLFDAIGDMIKLFTGLPKNVRESPDTSFMVQIFTDGEENNSINFNQYTLSNMIKDFSELPNWTFTFRGNERSSGTARRLNIPTENIHVWDGYSAQSYEASTVATQSSIGAYTTSIKRGQQKTTKFYANMDGITDGEIQMKAVDISGVVKVLTTTADEIVKPFVERTLGSFTKGTVYYQLTKSERIVQDYKIILIRNKVTGKVYGGRDARQILGLPLIGNCSLAPGHSSDYDIFVQSTSLNRKLPQNTTVIVWDGLQPVSTQVNTKNFITGMSVTKKSNTYWSDYAEGYKHGKNHKRRSGTADGYVAGYSDGRNKKLNLSANII